MIATGSRPIEIPGFKFDGQRIVLYSKSLDDPNARQSRTVTHLENGGKRIVHQQFVATPDGKDRLMMELVMDNRP